MLSLTMGAKNSNFFWRRVYIEVANNKPIRISLCTVSLSNKNFELFTCKDKSNGILLGLLVETDSLFVTLILP